MRVKIYIVLFILLLSAGSCIREKCYNKSKADYHYLDPATLPWFGMFKDGSWWVYEEEKTGLRDSMYVKNYDHYFHGMGCEFRENSLGEILSSYIFDRKVGFYYSLESTLKTSFNIGFYRVPYYNSSEDYFYYEHSGIITKVKYYPLIKSYSNVLLVTHLSDTLYFAKDIGIVRIVDEKNKRKFNLIKYEVVK